jgi:putative endonuclease
MDATGSALLKAAPFRGRWAEDHAAKYLESLGWRLVARNVRLAGGEIDLVAEDGDVQVFVEVKARQAADGSALESVSRDKQRRLGRAAASWVVRNGQPERGSRFDVVTVEGRGSHASVRHIRNAFETLGRFGV